MRCGSGSGSGRGVGAAVGVLEGAVGGGAGGAGVADGPVRPAVPSYHGGSIAVRCLPELTGSLRELSRQEGVTLFMMLLAAFQVLLSR